MTTFKFSTKRIINSFGDDIIQIKVENDITDYPRFELTTGISIADFDEHIIRYLRVLRSEVYRVGIDIEDSNFDKISQEITNLLLFL
jgi:hypothetical protein